MKRVTLGWMQTITGLIALICSVFNFFSYDSSRYLFSGDGTDFAVLLLSVFAFVTGIYTIKNK